MNQYVKYVVFLLAVVIQAAFAESLLLTGNVKFDDKSGAKSVAYAVDAFKQDIMRKFGNGSNAGSSVMLRFQIDESLNGFDRYQINVEPNSITFAGSDELGLIHAIYSFSGEILGIDPCIYFTGILPKQEKQIPLELGTIESKPYTFKHRVMFVNDEDLVIGFQMQKHSYGMNMEFMAKLFETMLRLEMTGVIPSTHVFSDEPHIKLASDMGLYIAQHHAEPVGSVPLYWPKNVPYSWSTQKDDFIKFWSDAIRRQKGKNVIWTLNFRGLSDRPFWRDDPSVSDDSPIEVKAKVVDEVIQAQYNLIKEITGNDKPILCTYLWGELGGMYRRGLLNYPEGTMILFNDGGNGVVSEDKWKQAAEREKGKGVYQHVSYHCRRTHIRINNIHPDTFQYAAKRAVETGATDMIVLNVGNFKEKIFGIRQNVLYMNHFEDFAGQPDGQWFFDWYAKNVLGTDATDIANAYRSFIDNQLYLQSPSKILGDEFFEFYAEQLLNVAYKKEANDSFFKELLTRSKYNSMAKLDTLNQKIGVIMDYVPAVFAESETKWQVAVERAYDTRRYLAGNDLDFYNVDLVYPTLKMMHLTGMAFDLTNAVDLYLAHKYHDSQLVAYQALLHAKKAIEVEKMIEQAGWGRFDKWYEHDETARTWHIEEMLSHFLDHLEDLKLFNYEKYDYRNSKTKGLQYKYQPYFDSEYRDEITYMVDGE